MFSRFALTPHAMLLLLAVVIASSNAWSSSDEKVNPDASRLVSVRSYVPQQFDQPVLDRLSGGLSQRFPYRMAVDARGRILVTDPGLSVVHVIDTGEGKRWQIRGGVSMPPLSFDYRPGRYSSPSLAVSGGAIVTDLRLAFAYLSDARQAKIRDDRMIAPAFVAVDADDNIYVTDLQRRAVLVFQPSGEFMYTIGSGVFALPTGIAIDKQNRNLYVADWWKNQILLFSLDGKLLHTFGTPGTGPGQFRGPLDVVLHHDTVVVRDVGNSRLQVFDLQGNVRSIRPDGPLGAPVAFTFDRDGNLYYSDLDSGGLVAVNGEGKVLATFDVRRSFGQKSPRPTAPNFVCVTTDQNDDILALRPNLSLEVVRIVDTSSAKVHGALNP